MWRMEDVLRELKEEGILEYGKSEKSGVLPPGFRFHPTDEELITFYLASKVFHTSTTTSSNSTSLFLSNAGVQIVEVDLSRCEPWDLPERAKMGEREWYLYSLRDRKYPSGLRTNRATETGYWKATGKDRQVYASGVNAAAGGAGGVLIGMKKTLVFYQGRAPRGVKTRWLMHEYRLDGHFSSFRLSKEEWVICRIFHKNGEKKSSPIIHQPPPASPPQLSTFLSSLPPLQEPTTTSSTTQVVANTPVSHQPPPYVNQDYPNYSLLHSLLLNPLPNFSSISGSDTIFPPLNVATASPPLFKPFQHQIPCLSTNTTVTKQCQSWLDKICPQIHQCHDSLNFDEMDDTRTHHHHHPVPTSYRAEPDDNDGDTVGGGGVVQHDMSPSLAVTALDKMLNHSTNNHTAESWCFHPS